MHPVCHFIIQMQMGCTFFDCSNLSSKLNTTLFFPVMVHCDTVDTLVKRKSNLRILYYGLTILYELLISLNRSNHCEQFQYYTKNLINHRVNYIILTILGIQIGCLFDHFRIYYTVFINLL